MHMADALLSPAVGGAMTVVAVGALGYSAKKIAKEEIDEKIIPMMGVMGAFVFAGQMINFTIPGTGSSGHIGGGILLAALLGPYASLLTIASVLLIQCLFFADGGLLAFGCNVFNLGVVACLLCYPFVFKPLVKKGINTKSLIIASVVSVVVALQIGSFCVVLETLLSGITELPFSTFLLLMQPIHLAIGIVEGLVTAAVLCYIHSTRPEILESAAANKKIEAGVSLKGTLITFVILAALVGGGLSLFASAFPDGLEWSMENVAGTTELEQEGAVYDVMAQTVEKTAFMPDYSFAGDEEGSALGTTTAGIVGCVITILLAAGIGFGIKAAKKSPSGN